MATFYAKRVGAFLCSTRVPSCLIRKSCLPPLAPPPPSLSCPELCRYYLPFPLCSSSLSFSPFSPFISSHHINSHQHHNQLQSLIQLHLFTWSFYSFSLCYPFFFLSFCFGSFPSLLRLIQRLWSLGSVETFEEADWYNPLFSRSVIH